MSDETNQTFRLTKYQVQICLYLTPSVSKSIYIHPFLSPYKNMHGKTHPRNGLIRFSISTLYLSLSLSQITGGFQHFSMTKLLSHSLSRASPKFPLISSSARSTKTFPFTVINLGIFAWGDDEILISWKSKASKSAKPLLCHRFARNKWWP